MEAAWRLSAVCSLAFGAKPLARVRVCVGERERERERELYEEGLIPPFTHQDSSEEDFFSTPGRLRSTSGGIFNYHR